MTWTPRLKWRRTPVAGAEQDWWADAPAPPGYCRVYYAVHVGKAAPWYWCAATVVAVGAGYCASAREAAEAAERSLFAGLGLEYPGPPAEASS